MFDMPTQYGSVWAEHQNLYRVTPCYISGLSTFSLATIFHRSENFCLGQSSYFLRILKRFEAKPLQGGKRTDVIFSGKIQWFQLQDQGHNNIKADFSGRHPTGLHLRSEIQRSSKTTCLLDQDLVIISYGWLKHCACPTWEHSSLVQLRLWGSAERIHGITYHISSSPYYSEDIHTNYPRVSLKGVMTQG